MRIKRKPIIKYLPIFIYGNSGGKDSGQTDI